MVNLDANHPLFNELWNDYSNNFNEFMEQLEVTDIEPELFLDVVTSLKRLYTYSTSYTSDNQISLNSKIS